MSDLQHQRIVELCQELRLSAMPNLYSDIAQSAAAKDAADSDGSRPGFRDDLARHSDLMSLAVPR